MSTRAEVCAVACADLFAHDGEILASPMGTMPLIGARLARLTSNPDLLVSAPYDTSMGGGGVVFEFPGTLFGGP